MIDIKDVMPIPFLKKEAFTGSYQGMRYRMEKMEVPISEDSEEIETRLCVHIWPQPFCFDKTDDSQKSHHFFDFSQEGIASAVDWLNQKYTDEKKRWTKE
ncbi:hypothetical protein [Frisingicoccus sp.]|uniref:hypothetical protein n=1 Tax=Frisingicoccus sp. TaxID=1918627 RepID=UPI002E9A678E|nr:hypothetical protein [Frisingicoccus sp.]